METDFPTWLKRFSWTAASIRQTQDAIHSQLLSASPYLKSPNFAAMHVSDLKRLFQLYDQAFFEQRMGHYLRGRPLSFAISRRMTSSAGQTTHFKPRGASSTAQERFVIGVSATLLFQNFRENGETLLVTGLTCQDRLAAMQRVFEHELVHLLEMMTWDQSSCSARRFQGIAAQLFLHAEHTHRLITPREQAYRKFGLRAGDRVRFRIDGEEHVGRINRITKRATVLVENATGQPYSDGKRYTKFYVPVSLLRPAQS